MNFWTIKKLMFVKGDIKASIIGKKILIETNDPLEFLRQHSFEPSKDLIHDAVFAAQEYTSLETKNIEDLKDKLGSMDEKDVSKVLALIKPQTKVGGSYYNDIDQSILDTSMKVCDIIKLYNIDKSINENVSEKVLGHPDIKILLAKKNKIANDQRTLKQFPKSISKYQYYDKLIANRIAKINSADH